MTTVNEALNNVRAQVGSGVSVGNGECYALASWYERMISPDATVGLGAGVGWVSGAIGDTISAKNIGSSYNWQANGWTVSTSGAFVPGQILTLGATATNQYGHVVIVEAVNGDQLTILEQNMYGKRYPTRNYYSAASYRQQVVHYITPPGAVAQTAPNMAGARTYCETGTMTVTVDAINVRRAPNTSGQIVAVYKSGESFDYDTVIIDVNGYVWVSYIGSSGIRNYVATGATKDGKRFGEAWGTFK
ncbi:PlySs2 family phage lysin [Streptococcus suis]|uniref:PlySs2 family phage lysin n=1 Tax=Streptococcus suis TaxID=1307 RepID=UPI00040D21E0|nr:PlySs2 family phage lysin [Streptococcus suis]QBX30529.1 lysin [Streptococcus phage Javan554]MCH1644798.1 PlySs2 family phage lysin [Streptococcus suis]NQI84010.1 PlySs2 family phage lysin [Streptococcus suis]NQK18114.1 PlySs2 family phage lysin [Streptococcus suis]HEL1616963.1 PlySs2 family phage lysin [Streptococcus suis]